MLEGAAGKMDTTKDAELHSYKTTAFLRLRVANAWLAEDIVGVRQGLKLEGSFESPGKTGAAGVVIPSCCASPPPDVQES